MQVLNLILDKTDVGAGPWIGGGESSDGKRSIQVTAHRNGTGNFAAVVRVFGANDIRFPVQLMDVSLDQSTPTEAVEVFFKWAFFSAQVISISGAATAVSAIMSV